MPQDTETRLEQGFAAALNQPAAERSAFLDTFCGEDRLLRQELDELLRHHVDDDFMDCTALELESVRQLLLAPSFPKGRTIGPYRILDLLGSGGMAVVYRAKRDDGAFDKEFAIKVFDRFHSATGGDEARFLAERRILGHLKTPYIAEILDAGMEDGQAYFVMEYVDGNHIDQYCRLNELAVPDRLRLFLKVCEGVSVAHNNRIVHRDLKPANILVDKNGVPKLIDFGIAKVLDSHSLDPHTAPGMELMTLLYASPERLMGIADVGDLPSSDIYSLGVILYELLTGRRPVEPSETTPRLDVPRYLAETDPPPPSKLVRELAGDLDTIVMKALSKERRLRYLSVEQFAVSISLFLDNRPLPDRPPGVAYRARKFIRRNMVSVAFSALLLVTLVGGIYATWRQAQIANRRFEQVRQVATGLLFEFDAAIANLSGATKARQMVVAKGVEYLDRLSADSTGDDRLKEEIADAYERLAGIQGNVYQSNLGDYKMAASSYKQALAIRMDLASRHPADPKLRRSLGDSHLQFADGLFTQGNTKDAANEYRLGLGILETLAQEGDRSIRVEAGLQRGFSRLCNFLLSQGDSKGALDNCDKAVDAAQSLVAVSPGDTGRRAVLAAAEGLSGNALRSVARPKEALPHLNRSVSEFEALLREQPNNNAVAKNLAGTYSVRGITKSALGETGEAIVDFQNGLTIVREMVRRDPADARAKTTLALALIRLSGTLNSAGRDAEAVSMGAEGLEIFRTFADRPQAVVDDWNTYASFLCEIQVPALRNPAKALGYAKRAVAGVKEPSLVLLSTLTDAYEGVGDVPHAIATARKALAESPVPASGGGGEAGLRSDLAKKLKRLEGLAAH